ALSFHKSPTPGKLAVRATKPMATQRDLSLAYSPGVAWPVRAIAEDPDAAYDYTSKGNMVAVVSNGTAILGLGALGAAASKPVMEGKSVLFKRFADVDSIDIEVEETDPERFIECVKGFGNTFGGINLEDIKSPDCFEIESRLRDELDVPVFHDDQHGTAIIAAAGFLNACDLTNRKIEDVRVVLIGAGAAGLSVIELLKSLGVRDENVVVLDSKGVVYKGRTGKQIHPRLEKHAIDTNLRTLEEAVEGRDLLLGLAIAGVVTKDMVKTMADNPMIFAMANPDPEITPEEVAEVRDDAIMATGRSDYPNQVNNVLGFPYIFRGALDVRARTINEPMKLACARALAQLAREDVPDEVAAAYAGRRLSYGRDYIIPAPFDPRLISYIPPFVAKAAMDSGVARRSIEDMTAYQHQLERRLNPSAGLLQRLHSVVRARPKTVVFAEGEEPSVLRAAMAFQTQGFGKALLVGREEQVERNKRMLSLPADVELEVVNSRLSRRNAEYVDFLYERLNREGYLRRDVQRLVNQDRNVFSSCMVALGHADGVVTGVTRHFDNVLQDVLLAIDPEPGERVMGMSIVLAEGQTLFVADTNVQEFPEPEALADIACEAARAARLLGFTPRVAFLSYSNFGQPKGDRMRKMREAVAILDERGVEFEYEGDMAADVALDPQCRRTYPFSRLTEPANVLVMPAAHSASIATKLLGAVGGATVIGPVLVGLSRPVQICKLGAPVSDIVTMAVVAAHGVHAATEAEGAAQAG
ncbi:MAG: NADP-dependent malic enzyme, partial [Caulobacterales bacterium]|nr:NADP-dependent malic enzyme [Caulobacterales bacterium]